jgi:hypothetical protein
MGYVRASQKKETTVQRKQHVSNANPKTTKQLLGDLYEDRAFLEKLINNTSNHSCEYFVLKLNEISIS